MELASYTTDYDLCPSNADEKTINAIWDQFQEQPVELAEHVTMKQHDNITTKLFCTSQNNKPVWVIEKVSHHRYCVWVYDDKTEALSDYIGCIEIDL